MVMQRKLVSRQDCGSCDFEFESQASPLGENRVKDLIKNIVKDELNHFHREWGVALDVALDCYHH